jgi:hypothetical protein
VISPAPALDCLNECLFHTQSGNGPVARKRWSGECLLSRDGAARLLVAQDWETIIHELRNAIAEAVDALRLIEEEEVTDPDIVRAPAEDEDEE